MKKIFCDFCRVEFDEGDRESWGRWNKIVISTVGTRPLGDETFDACSYCAKKIAKLVKLFQYLYMDIIEFDNMGKKPIHSEVTMNGLRSILDMFHLHVNERNVKHRHNYRSGKELFLKCPQCEGEVEMGLVGKAGSKLYFGCPVCERMVGFIQSDASLSIGVTRIIQ